MHPQKIVLVLLNLLAGPAVLASYAWSASAWPSETLAKLWGDVPDSVRPWYTAWMFVAAAGYLVYMFLLVFRVDPLRVRVAGRFGFGLFNVLVVLILIPSAAWMPLSLHYLDQPSPLLATIVVAGLWATGLASLGMIAALATLEPKEPVRLAKAAVAGAVAFAGQTFVLDACVWTLLFRW